MHEPSAEADDDAPSRCIECRAALVRDVTSELRTIAGQTFELHLPARVCPECGDSYVTCQALERSELSVALELARAGVRTREAFEYMRKALGLSRTQLAEVLGMTHETIFRWETMVQPEARAFALMGLLVSDMLEGRSTARLMLDASLGRGPITQPTGPRKIVLA